MERLFGLDMQLIADTLLTAISVFVLFTLASYLFFDTVRDVLKKRQDRIKSDLDTASKEKSDALGYKAEYESKLRDADRAVEEILKAVKEGLHIRVIGDYDVDGICSSYILTKGF